MFTYQTTDQKEARRLRIAQFNGRSATVRSAGATVTGLVRSIVEGSTGGIWVVTIIPDEPKAAIRMTRYAPHMPALAEDF
jgi:hypothetical protein